MNMNFLPSVWEGAQVQSWDVIQPHNPLVWVAMQGQEQASAEAFAPGVWEQGPETEQQPNAEAAAPQAEPMLARENRTPERVTEEVKKLGLEKHKERVRWCTFHGRGFKQRLYRIWLICGRCANCGSWNTYNHFNLEEMVVGDCPVKARWATEYSRQKDPQNFLFYNEVIQKEGETYDKPRRMCLACNGPDTDQDKAKHVCPEKPNACPFCGGPHGIRDCPLKPPFIDMRRIAEKDPDASKGDNQHWQNSWQNAQEAKGWQQAQQKWAGYSDWNDAPVKEDDQGAKEGDDKRLYHSRPLMCEAGLARANLKPAPDFLLRLTDGEDMAKGGILSRHTKGGSQNKPIKMTRACWQLSPLVKQKSEAKGWVAEKLIKLPPSETWRNLDILGDRLFSLLKTGGAVIGVNGMRRDEVASTLALDGVREWLDSAEEAKNDGGRSVSSSNISISSSRVLQFREISLRKLTASVTEGEMKTIHEEVQAGKGDWRTGLHEQLFSTMTKAPSSSWLNAVRSANDGEEEIVALDEEEAQVWETETEEEKEDEFEADQRFKKCMAAVIAKVLL